MLCFLGYRYNTKSGFYVGSGGVIGEFSVVQKINFVPNIAPPLDVSYFSGRTYNLDQFITGALTLGYDHIFNNGVIISAHAMRSLPRDIKDNESGGTVRNFYIQSINIGLGYNFP